MKKISDIIMRRAEENKPKFSTLETKRVGGGMEIMRYMPYFDLPEGEELVE